MGYRHQVMSDTMVPKKGLMPDWFYERYEGIINFDGIFWVSNNEYKRNSTLANFEVDIQKALIEIDHPDDVRLVFFADESDENQPDISHVTINQSSITELFLMPDPSNGNENDR